MKALLSGLGIIGAIATGSAISAAPTDISCPTCPHSLVVGVSSYPNLPPAWQLPGGERLTDLGALAYGLQSNAYPYVPDATLGMIDRRNGRNLRLTATAPESSDSPTRANVEAAFKRLAVIPWNVQSVVILSGRVARQADGAAVFLPADAGYRTGSADDFENAITGAELLSWLKATAAQVLLIVDATPAPAGGTAPALLTEVPRNVVAFLPNSASAVAGSDGRSPLLSGAMTIVRQLAEEQKARPRQSPGSFRQIADRIAAATPGNARTAMTVLGRLADQAFLGLPARPLFYSNAVTEAVNCGATATAPRTRALLLGIGEFTDKKLPRQNGTSNDVRLLRSTLIARGVSPGDIKMLEGTVTRPQVLDALNTLIGAVRCGDVVFLHFSGIGERVTFRMSDDRPEKSIEELGLATSDSQLDAGRVDDGWIRASEFATAVSALRNAGAFPVVAIDGCQAAGLNLGGRSHDGLWRWLPFGSDPAEYSVMPGAAGFAALYAAAEGNQTVEMMLPRGAADAQTYGLFTFALVSALGNPQVTSVRQVAEGIAAFYRGSELASSADASRPGFESTNPDQDLFSGRAPTRGLDIQLSEPMLTRGVGRAAATSTRVAGRVVPATGVRVVFVNDKESLVSPEGRFSVELPIAPGSNHVSIQTTTTDQRVGFLHFTLENNTPGAAPERPARTFALIIANQAYTERSGMRPLETPLGDATALAAVLRDRYGFELELPLPSGSKQSLEMQNAGRDQILTALTLLRQNLGENDALLIYYAGHGWKSKEADTSYWIPVDARRDNFGDYVSASDITDEIRRMNVRHVLVIADSCYAGGFTRSPDDPQATPATGEAAQRFIETVVGKRSRLLMSSGSDEPVLDGGGQGHSVFAKALLNGLQNEARSVFAAEYLFSRYIREPVAGASRQLPQYQIIQRSGHDGGDFVFFRR